MDLARQTRRFNAPNSMDFRPLRGLRVLRPRLRKSAHRRGASRGLYSARALRLGPALLFAPLLGLRFVSSLAGADRAELAGSPRYLRGDADRRRQIALLPIAGCDAARKNSNRDFAADRVDAGPGGAACQMGIAAALLNSSLTQTQQSAVIRAAREGQYRLLYRFARAPGARRHDRVARESSRFIFRHRRGALHFRVGPRVPAGIPAIEPPASPFSRLRRSRPSPPAPRGECGTTSSSSLQLREPRQVHRQLSPAEFALHRQGVRRAARQPQLLLKTLRRHAGET